MEELVPMKSEKPKRTKAVKETAEAAPEEAKAAETLPVEAAPRVVKSNPAEELEKALPALLRDPGRCFGERGEGVHLNVLEEEYHSNPAISMHRLWQAATPRHLVAKWLPDRKKDSTARRLGRNIHAACLTPQLFEETVRVGPISDRRLKAWKEFETSLEGQPVILMTPNEYEQIEGMARALDRHDTAKAYLANGDNEVSIFQFDPKKKLCLRGRTDQISVSDQVIVDYKTCESAELREFAKSGDEYGYYFQDAFYSHLAELAFGVPFRFVFIAQEKSYPYEVQIFEYEVSDRAYARDLVEVALTDMDDLLTRANFRGYPDHTQTIRISGWRRAQDRATLTVSR